MLPNWSESKSAMNAAIEMRMQEERAKRTPVPHQNNTHILHEGHEFNIKYPDGRVDVVPLQSAEAFQNFPISEMDEATIEDLYRIADNIGEQLAKQQSEHFYQEVTKASDSPGSSIVLGKGEPTPQMIYEMLEKIPGEYDSEGRPLTSFVIGPHMTEMIKDLEREIESSPEWKAKFDELESRKRQEFRDREAARKLVG